MLSLEAELVPRLRHLCSSIAVSVCSNLRHSHSIPNTTNSTVSSYIVEKAAVLVADIEV